MSPAAAAWSPAPPPTGSASGGNGESGPTAEVRQGGSERRFALTLLLPMDAASVPMVRHLCAQALREVGAAENAIRDVELAVTEACANVVRHAGGGDRYEVAATLSASSCHVEVRDYGKGLPADMLSAESTDGRPDAEGGRGFGLIRFFMDGLALGNEPDVGAVVQMSKQLPPDPGR